MARQGGVNSEKRIRKTSKEYVDKFRSKRSNDEREKERRKDKNRKTEKRMNMTEDEVNLMKEKDRIRKQKNGKSEKRLNMTEDEKNLIKEKDRIRKQKNKKSEKRLNMTEEERNLMKEKDRIRKQKKRNEKKEQIKADLHKRKKEGEFAHKGEYYRAKDKRFKACGIYMKNKNDANYMDWYSRTHKRISRDKLSEEQKEFEKIEQVIMMRKQRKLRDGKAHLLDNLEAKRDMRSLREIGPLKDYMRRKAREQDEEILWKSFWEKGAKFKELLRKKKPELVRLFQEREEMKRKEKEEYERKEEVLDKKGRWKYDNCDGEFYWSIPDENGHNMSLAEFNREDEEVPLTKEEILQKAKEFRERNGESQEDRDNEDEAYSQALREIYDYEGEMRRRKRKEKKERLKEEMSRPIDMPDCGKKSEYEKLRDENIRARYDAMKESGMFSDKELKEMLKSKIYE